ncbi:hypothetical protein CP583_21860 [Salmonella enterica]|nr:hypothetical protein [Salmonella enterica]EAM5854608.1 hypothetical protein [Salmonella enterica]EAO3632992.1 hypothetical protein [Salmonella enterica]EAS3180254.1 hypothetical protein [Salmonella enterica]EBP1618048.1 hypothetical protein [Salmonella enterica]
MTTETVLDALMVLKKASAVELSARTGRDKNQVIRELWELKEQGLVGQNSRAWWVMDVDASGLSESEATPEEKLQKSSVTEVTAVTEVTEVVQSIPSFTKKRPDVDVDAGENADADADDLIIPAPRFISAEIRRTKAKLKRLHTLREISRKAHSPGNRKLAQHIQTGVTP